MDDTNPYASPRGMEDHAAETGLVQVEIVPTLAWRDGDTLVLRRTGAVLPHACVKSNRSTNVARYVILTLSNTWACLLIPLFFVPFIGFFAVAVAIQLLACLGQVAKVKYGFRREVVALLVLLDVVAAMLLVGGNLLTGIGGVIEGNLTLLAAGFASSALGVLLASFPFSVFGYLRIKLADPDLVRVRGLHADYLKRLPEFGAQALAESGTEF